MVCQLQIAEEKDEPVNQAVHTAFHAFNHALANWPERQNFNVVLRDAERCPRGGILASVNFDVLVLEDVFVQESWRRDERLVYTVYADLPYNNGACTLFSLKKNRPCA